MRYKQEQTKKRQEICPFPLSIYNSGYSDTSHGISGRWAGVPAGQEDVKVRAYLSVVERSAVHGHVERPEFDTDWLANLCEGEEAHVEARGVIPFIFYRIRVYLVSELCDELESTCEKMNRNE